MSSMQWAWDSEGRDVPTLPTTDEEWLEQAPVVSLSDFDAIVAGLEPEVDASAVRLAPEHRAAIMMVDALTQICGDLGATEDIVIQLQDEHDGLAELMAVGPWQYLTPRTDEGENMLAVLDILTFWQAELAMLIAERLSEWLEAHLMPTVIFQWVDLPHMGFTKVRLGSGGEEPNVLLQVPKAMLYDQEEGS